MPKQKTKAILPIIQGNAIVEASRYLTSDFKCLICDGKGYYEDFWGTARVCEDCLKSGRLDQ